MPEIILKKEIIRKYGEFEKVFPEGSKYFVSWESYYDLLDKGYCNKIKDIKKQKVKLKKKTKKANENN